MNLEIHVPRGHSVRSPRDSGRRNNEAAPESRQQGTSTTHADAEVLVALPFRAQSPSDRLRIEAPIRRGFRRRSDLHFTVMLSVA